MAQPPDGPVSDADLVGRALLGARAPFAELVRRHQATATALAARVLGSEEPRSRGHPRSTAAR